MISKRTARNFLIYTLIDNKKLIVSAPTLLQELEAVQLDPVASVERNHHLVMGARLPSYQPGMLEALLEDGDAFEYIAQAACLLPMRDYPLFELTRRRIAQHLAPELERYHQTKNAILSRLADEGPLPSQAFRSTSKVRGGWDTGSATTKETSHVIALLFQAGAVQVAKRVGATRYFARTEDVIPPSLIADGEKMEEEEIKRLLLLKYARAYRLFDSGDPRYGWLRYNAKERRTRHESLLATDVFVPVQVEGVKRDYTILREDVDLLLSCENAPDPRFVQFFAPLDNLMWRRERVSDLFDFHYRWEIYMPKTKRKYGAYVMPIMEDGTFIGRIDPLFNRKSGVLTMQTLALEPGVVWTKKRQERVVKAFRRLGSRLGAQEVQECKPLFI
ncbi:DNA glycosylase AlkZ-like family protein [Shouchella shacheensis]|uniref:DNA glycosylase AlkZ-like family protein n=1 Tax=Shouchella shacheensis TaxID=1649580 RepID=UPI000B2A44C8|nr:crosslink repair DNA glycosylase YcaQ family protein [Shouchella shacheensis]